MKYQIINRLDEKDRYLGTIFYINGKKEQVDSHTFSYLFIRKMKKELYGNKPFGLELLIEEKNES